MGRIIPYIVENNPNVWNHQPFWSVACHELQPCQPKHPRRTRNGTSFKRGSGYLAQMSLVGSYPFTKPPSRCASKSQSLAQNGEHGIHQVVPYWSLPFSSTFNSTVIIHLLHFYHETYKSQAVRAQSRYRQVEPQTTWPPRVHSHRVPGRRPRPAPGRPGCFPAEPGRRAPRTAQLPRLRAVRRRRRRLRGRGATRRAARRQWLCRSFSGYFGPPPASGMMTWET